MTTLSQKHNKDSGFHNLEPSMKICTYFSFNVLIGIIPNDYGATLPLDCKIACSKISLVAGEQDLQTSLSQPTHPP